MKMDRSYGVIQTRYRDVLFRSRLEARWSVAFDHLGIDWLYEPEGFNVGGSSYLPDFYFPKLDLWAEVKGGGKDKKIPEPDARRMADVLDFGSPMSGITESADRLESGILRTARGVLLLSDIPDDYIAGSGMYVVHPIVQHHEGLFLNWATFLQGDVIDLCALLSWKELCEKGIPYKVGIDGDTKNWDLQHRIVDLQRLGDLSTPQCIAYASARSARFEHGQKGAV